MTRTITMRYIAVRREKPAARAKAARSGYKSAELVMAGADIIAIMVK